MHNNYRREIFFAGWTEKFNNEAEEDIGWKWPHKKQHCIAATLILTKDDHLPELRPSSEWWHPVPCTSCVTFFPAMW